MSVNMYLNNKVRKLPGFKSEPYRDCSGDKMTINGMSLFGDKGQLYAMLSDENSVVPEELKEMVEGFSFYDAIPQMARRESGIYRHETAECELTPEDYGSGKREKPVYKLKVTAKSLEDIRELVHKIKTGVIRPDESYEAPHSGKSRMQLEAELMATQQHLGEEWMANNTLRDELKFHKKALAEIGVHFDARGEKINLLRQIAEKLTKRFWALVDGREVARQINAILNPKPPVEFIDLDGE